MRITLKKILAILALWLVYVPMVHAQNLGQGILDDVAGKASIKPAGDVGLPQIIGNLIKIFMGALGLIFLILTVYAGYLYLTARGEEEKVKHAKETLQRGVIGMIIIMAAYVITTFVIGALTSTTAATPST